MESLEYTKNLGAVTRKFIEEHESVENQEPDTIANMVIALELLEKHKADITVRWLKLEQEKLEENGFTQLLSPSVNQILSEIRSTLIK